MGNQSEFDLLRARVTRDNQRPVVIQRRADRDLAHYRLKQLLDFPLDQPLALTTELGDTALVDSPRLSQLVANPGDTSTSTRAPVRQANEAVEAQRGLLRAAKGQRLPQVAAELTVPPAGLSQQRLALRGGLRLRLGGVGSGCRFRSSPVDGSAAR